MSVTECERRLDFEERERERKKNFPSFQSPDLSNFVPFAIAFV